jgi:hypothetical protein
LRRTSSRVSAASAAKPGGDATDSEATEITSSRPAISAANTEPPLDGASFSGWRTTVVNKPGGVTTGIRPEVWVVCAAP